MIKGLIFLILFASLGVSSHARAEISFTPHCPCPSIDLVTLTVEEPFFLGDDHYVFSIVQDKEGRPIGMEHRRVDAKGNNLLTFGTIPYGSLIRGISLFSVDPLSLIHEVSILAPFLLPIAVPLSFSSASLPIDWVKLKVWPVSPQDYELKLFYTPNYFWRNLKSATFHLVFENRHWVLRDDFGIVKELKLKAAKTGIEGVVR